MGCMQAMQAHRYELGQAGALDQAAAAQVLERTGDAVVQLGKHLDAQVCVMPGQRG